MTRAMVDVLAWGAVVGGVLVVATYLGGCGGSYRTEAVTAVVAACDAAETRAELDPETYERRVSCIRAVCDEAIEHIDPEATSGRE